MLEVEKKNWKESESVWKKWKWKAEGKVKLVDESVVPNAKPYLSSHI